MSDFGERVERARQRPQSPPMVQPGNKPGQEVQRRTEARRHGQDNRQATADLERRAKAIVGLLKTKVETGHRDKYPDFAVIGATSPIFDKARKKRNGNRSPGLGGVSAMPSPSPRQHERWLDRGDRYLETQLAKRALPAWSMGIPRVRMSSDDDFAPVTYREHVLAWDGSIYDRDPHSDTLLRATLTGLFVPALELDIIRVSTPYLAGSGDISGALDGLSNVVARFDLDVTTLG